MARFPVRGHEGVNRVRFFGEVRGHPLPPGTYFLRPRIGGPGRPGPRGVPVTVRDGERPTAVPGPTDARCSPQEGVALASGRVLRDAAPELGQRRQPPEATRGAVHEERQDEPRDEDERSVAPPGPAGPPSESPPGREALPALLGGILLALGAAAGLYIVVYVVRFLRQPHY